TVESLYNPLHSRSRSLKMQFPNMLQVMMALLLWGEAAYADPFGCKDRVKDFPISGSVAMIPKRPRGPPSPMVNHLQYVSCCRHTAVMTSPWDNIANAYDCVHAPTDHKRPCFCYGTELRLLPTLILFWRVYNGWADGSVDLESILQEY
ncbi:hypothetical protein MJO29_013120, partial [Puccinia striiformis f. sp. tritici]